MFILKSYFSTFAVFLVIDLIWLGFIAKNLYAKYLGYIMANNINWTAAIIFYVIFVGGILFFVIKQPTNFSKNFMRILTLTNFKLIIFLDKNFGIKYGMKL